MKLPSSRGMKMAIAAVAVALFGGAWAWGSKPWSFTKSVEVDRGIYFRLKVGLSYKGSREDFDIVVGCNAKRINYRDGSSTAESGLIPTLYGRAMPDGKAVVIRPPNACSREIFATGWVRPGFIPLIVVFDDAKLLTTGIAYVTDDAYRSPHAVLQFHSATVEKATRADFETFMRTAPPNVVTRESYHSFQSDDVFLRLGLKRVPPLALSCKGYERVKLDERIRPIVAKLWPAERPEFWTTPGGYLSHELAEQMRKAVGGHSRGTRDDVPAFPTPGGHTSPSPSNEGIFRKDGLLGITAPTNPEGTRVAPTVYPSTSELVAYRKGDDREEWLSRLAEKQTFVTAAIDFKNGEWRGFAYCFNEIGWPHPDHPAKNESRKKISAATVDGSLVEEIQARPLVPSNGNISVFFERDEYMWRSAHYGIDSVWGDLQ